jgi:hypothetical protein
MNFRSEACVNYLATKVAVGGFSPNLPPPFHLTITISNGAVYV